MNEKTVNAIAEYEPIAAALAGIEKYRGLVVDVTTPQGMKEAKAALREIAAPRIALEKARTRLKADVLERGRLIDGEAKRIGALFAEIEDPIKKQVDAEEERAERERQAAIEAEQRRLAEEEAARKRAEEERLAAERAEIARQQAALKAAQDKAEEEARARRAAIAAEEEAARQRIAEADRLAREKREAEEAKVKAARDRIDAERRAEEERKHQAQLAEQRAKEEAERREREQAEALEREARRIEAEKLDSRRMLETFCERFEHLHPELVKTIRAYLNPQLKVAA